MITLVVALTLLGAGNPGEQERIDFLRKPIEIKEREPRGHRLVVVHSGGTAARQ